jgi:hypothetical protein
MSSIGTEFNNNAISGIMVVAMIVMILIMVVDRFFYSK